MPTIGIFQNWKSIKYSCEQNSSMSSNCLRIKPNTLAGQSFISHSHHSHSKLQEFQANGHSGNLCLCLFLGHAPAFSSVHPSPFSWCSPTGGFLESSVQQTLHPEKMLFPLFPLHSCIFKHYTIIFVNLCGSKIGCALPGIRIVVFVLVCWDHDSAWHLGGNQWVFVSWLNDKITPSCLQQRARFR